MTTRTPAAPVRLAKTQRQHVVAKLLSTHAVTSQEQLVALLAKEGVAATQATVSRDLDEIGAVKVRTGGGETLYAVPELPKDQRAPEDLLRRAFAEFVVEVAHSANLVVLRTPPGTANLVAAALDRASRRCRRHRGRRRHHHRGGLGGHHRPCARGRSREVGGLVVIRRKLCARA
ncbi:MAG: hypothetical protein R2701_05705 [Acidimicrobiales bacterium]